MFLSKEDSHILQPEVMRSVSPCSMTLQLLYSALVESACENRLVQGPSDCIELLSRNPDKVVVCLLPVDESDKNVSLSIQLILIESLCQECNIPIVKVDKNQIKDAVTSSMKNVLYGTTPSQRASTFLSELDCCFIESQGESLGTSEKKLMNFLHDIQNDNKENSYTEYPK